ncbi:MAG: adenosine deaminase [Anaerolineae bacterium]|nr:adenosine deaminase [Anaerolineae bacterium]
MQPPKPDPTRRDLLHRLPKVGLHRHLEGSLRLETLVEIAQTDNIGVPARTVTEMRALVTMANRRGDNHAYLQKFNTLRLFYRTPEIIHRFAYEAVADAAADNVRYLELRFTPRALASVSGFPFEQVTDWVCDAVQRSAADHNIMVRIILSMNRHEAVSIGEKIAQVAVDRAGQGVVGLDIGGDEASYSARPFGPLFIHAKQSGLGITMHAGEWSGAASVRDAIENWSADRIGHGVRVVEDSEVAALARDRGVVFEVCPTSNLQSGVVPHIGVHPLRDMFYLGLKVTLNTDNTGVSGVTLTDEVATVMDGLGFTLRDIKQMQRTSCQAAFLPEAERAALLQRISAELDEFPDEI